MHLASHLVRLMWAYERAGRTADAAALTDWLRGLFEARQQELDALAATGAIVPAAQWNTICWWAGLAGMFDLALQACDAAAEGAAGATRGSHHDSRGVARAVAGDLEGAIADFEAYLQTRSRISPSARQRRAWVESLRRGQNPFTPDLVWRALHVATGEGETVSSKGAVASSDAPVKRTRTMRPDGPPVDAHRVRQPG